MEPPQEWRIGTISSRCLAHNLGHLLSSLSRCRVQWAWEGEAELEMEVEVYIESRMTLLQRILMKPLAGHISKIASRSANYSTSLALIMQRRQARTMAKRGQRGAEGTAGRNGSDGDLRALQRVSLGTLVYL